MSEPIEITGEITGISYFAKLIPDLPQYSFSKFNVNHSEGSFILKNGSVNFFTSKWVSPKRTRSYPYARVYNTLSGNKRITIIPLVKDEGANGDRDFIQWDTISLMSLLDVNVILGYYKTAEQSNSSGKAKITNQQFDNSYIKRKIRELQGYQSSALHWNLSQIQTGLDDLMNKVIASYSRIEKRSSVKLHSSAGLQNFKDKIIQGYENFMKFSREKAMFASKREIRTSHKLEYLSTASKARITIKNYLGGLYYFTVDEALINIRSKIVELIESKNSTSAKLPSQDDIKDGLLKMILYSNLKEVKIDGIGFLAKPILNLTSVKNITEFNSEMNDSLLDNFMVENNFNKSEKALLLKLINEARTNNFLLKVGKCR